MSLLGAVIGIANIQAWAPPANGAVKDGWALCDGQSFSGLGAGNYDSAFSGNLPNISSLTFIMGFTAGGNTGGTNSYNLIQANLPAMTSAGVSADHSHVVSGTTANNGLNDHTHWTWTGNVDRDHTHNFTRIYTNYYNGPHSVIANEATKNQPTSNETLLHTHGQASGGIDTNHSHGGSYSSGYSATDHTHTYTNSSQAAISHLPPYITGIYVMAVNAGMEIPLGSVVAIANPGVWSLPGAGVVKDGWALCNGQSFSGLGAGNYNPVFTGNTPQLSDDRFLSGAGSTYSTGGAASITLVAANIPSLTASSGHSADHYHAGTIATGAVSADHTHNSGLGTESANHLHYYGYVGGALYNAASTFISNAATVSLISDAASQTHYHAMGVGTANGGAHVLSPGSGVVMAKQSASHTHAFGTVANTAISRLPKYLKCVYIIKVN